MSLEHDHEKNGGIETSQVVVSEDRIIKDGGLTFTAAEGINSTAVTYQDAAGAPVETNSPLGYSVSFWTSLCLNINQMIGTGIFSTRESVELQSLQFCSLLTLSKSRLDSRGSRLGWTHYGLLVYRIPSFREHPCTLPGVHLLLPQSIGSRGRIPRTGISIPQIFLPDNICRKACGFLFWKQ